MKKIPLDFEQEFTWKKDLDKKEEKSPFLRQLTLLKPTLEENITTTVKKRKCFDDLNDKLSTIVLEKKNEKNVEKIHFIHILISYLHLLINSIITVLFIYIVFSLLFFIKRDINHKITERKAFIRNIVEEGNYHYKINRCDPRTRVPALNLKCTEWEVMKDRKIDSVEVTKIVLEVIGESLDGFVRRFSVKSCLIGGMFFCIFMIFRNVRFGK
ncbi:Nucleus export BRR6 protein [Tubulinosema ratisbonensis]|uniref:Nucleus export BRR6 protein n=1 Tax=Tubulinosema ratisbonensis TaxID=291195 RepID=A0A437AP83_9MICR|nr:Nucleus export BRR6 protein [Tubulinosema ratisbonensis]